MVRQALRHVIGTPHLWEHFANAQALEAFWSMPDAERQKLWGDPFDPLCPVKDFDTSCVSDEQLR